MQMQVTFKEQKRGPTLKLIFFAVGTWGETFSTGFNVDDMALINFDFHCNRDNTMNTSARVKKSQTTKSSRVKISITCETSEKELICPDNWSENIKVKEFRGADFVIGVKRAFSLEVTVTVQDTSHVTLLSNRSLYDDQQFTDFQLSTADGSVKVHKAILAIHSELFRALLAEGCSETDGRFTIRGVTVQTLQQLKDYVYLGTLPTVGLPELLMVAIHSKMTNLKNDCMMKLASQVSAADLDGLIEFAATNNVPDLMLAILSVTPDSAVHGAHKTRKSRLQFNTVDYKQLALE